MTSREKYWDDIELSEVAVGRDVLLVITGGARHIGAASTAFIQDGKAEVQTSAVPRHKEHLVTEKVALRVAAALGKTVTVVMGIHYDDISKEDIFAVVNQVDIKVEQYLAQQK
ncbi:hypothetical protein J7E73_01830 [Paenibacillus albidus]|uniref:prenylated flavin chaperone LpdD n=1 Tax=Paenibacillus albidus TaxID=2041023 RepID=UPI001BEA5B26|nr:hypothetical protein [Paenibacillus albidus]MBT2287885.1 hypothetical protein [Paenibacillus albidus]